MLLRVLYFAALFRTNITRTFYMYQLLDITNQQAAGPPCIQDLAAETCVWYELHR